VRVWWALPTSCGSPVAPSRSPRNPPESNRGRPGTSDVRHHFWRVRGSVPASRFDTAVMKTMLRAPMAGTCVGCRRGFRKYDYVFRKDGKYICVDCERGTARR
jgi:hypothetical protein